MDTKIELDGGTGENNFAELIKKAVDDRDPEFPFGRPADINYDKVDEIGRPLIKEINKRAWVQSTEYCSGHPPDRPLGEKTKWYPGEGGQKIFQDCIGDLMRYRMNGVISQHELDMKMVDLHQRYSSYFYLNVNVYQMNIFRQWLGSLQRLIFEVWGEDALFHRILDIKFHPIRPQLNFTIRFTYFSVEDREKIHQTILDSLHYFPV